MISDDLYTLADKLSVYALAGVPLPASTAACMARALMDHARTAAILETLPFRVTGSTMTIAERLRELAIIQPSEHTTRVLWEVAAALDEKGPDGALVRAVEASKERPWPKDLGGTQEQWR